VVHCDTLVQTGGSERTRSFTGRQDLDIDLTGDGSIDPTDIDVPAADTLEVNCVE